MAEVFLQLYKVTIEKKNTYHFLNIYFLTFSIFDIFPCVFFFPLALESIELGQKCESQNLRPIILDWTPKCQDSLSVLQESNLQTVQHNGEWITQFLFLSHRSVDSIQLPPEQN